MQVKNCPAAISAGPKAGLEEGVVEAIVATYDVDSVGDQIMPGAFADTLAEWKASGHPIPFLWSHKSDDPEAHIGWIEEAEERPGQGLYVKARIDMEEPSARRVYKLLRANRVRQYSFAYDELDARPAGEKAAPGAVKELHRLKLYEAGPTPVGCNQNTSTLAVKHDQPQGVTVNVNTAPAEQAAKITDSTVKLKAGRVLSKQNEDRVAQIARLASELLASVKAEAEGDGEPVVESNAEKATPNQPAGTSAPEATSEPAPKASPEAALEAKATVPAASGSASERLRTELELLELDSYAI